MSTILRWERRTTRKPHRCFGCGRVYPAGTKMVNAAYIDGGVSSCYWCETCEEWMSRFSELGDEYCYTDLRYANNWNDLHKEIGAMPYIGEEATHGTETP